MAMECVSAKETAKAREVTARTRICCRANRANTAPSLLTQKKARKAKLQGNVTLRVLVGVDGRAQNIRMVKVLGLGLDQQTLESIHMWRFAPALDVHRQPAAVWVTI
jgi:TonB family protein